MSRYPSLLPSSISSTQFTYNGSTFTITASSAYDTNQFPIYNWFGVWGVSANVEPPHWVQLKSSIYFITDQFDFRANTDGEYMTCNKFNIETSKDGVNWNIVYSGNIPNVRYNYSISCTYTPSICKYIRLRTLSTWDQRGYRWLQASYLKPYGIPFNPESIYKDQYDNGYGVV